MENICNCNYIWLGELGHDVIEIGETETEFGYPIIGEKTSLFVTQGKAEFGIVICGTGMGISMAAGKVPGIRVALCCDVYMGEMAKVHNNANMLAFGCRVLAFEKIQRIIDTYMSCAYGKGRHDERVQKLKETEERYLKR